MGPQPTATPEDDHAQGLARWAGLRLRIATWIANLLTLGCLLGPAFAGRYVDLPSIWVMVALVPAMLLVHELVHAAAFVAMGAPVTSVRIGYDDRRHMAYCSCTAELPMAGMRFVLLAPMVLGGVIPYGVSFAADSGTLFFFSALMIGSAGGDIVDFVAPMPKRRPALPVQRPTSVEEARTRIQPRPSALRDALAEASSREVA